MYRYIPAKLLLIRVASEDYFLTLERHAAFLQRIFRGHQARKYYLLRKEAKDKGVPVSLLKVKSVQASMKSNPSNNKNGLTLMGGNANDITSQQNALPPPLPNDLTQLKDELMSSMHEIFKETLREEIGKMKAGL